MAASGCWRPGTGKDVMLWVTGEWPIFPAFFHLFLFQKISVLLGQCLQSLSPTWFLRASSVSSLPSPFLSSSVLAFSVQIGLWDSCPKPFIWTVYRVKYVLMRPLVARASREQARRGSPVALYGLLGPAQYKPREWLARMGVYCRHSPSLSPPVPVTPTLHALSFFPLG